MNTSTKILLGLVIIVFAVPGLLAMTLISKVKNKEFKAFKMENNIMEKTYEANIAPYKAITIDGAGLEEFNIRINHSDSARYFYRMDAADNDIFIDVVNDTLTVKYAPKSGKNNYAERSIELYLPEIKNLSVDGASIYLDSMISGKPFSATLKNNAQIRQKSPNDHSMNTPVLPKSSQTITTTVETTETITLTETEKVNEIVNQNMPANKEVKDVVIFHLM